MCIFEGDPEQPTTANRAIKITTNEKIILLVKFNALAVNNLIKCTNGNHTLCSSCAILAGNANW